MRMEQKILTALEKFGLSDKEARVYFACVELGISPAYQISVHANMPRTLTYDILKRLMELRLVNLVMKEEKKYFRSENPVQLLEILKEKESAVKTVMGSLLALQGLHTEKKKPHVHVFEGKEGIKNIFEDILKSNVKEYIAIGGSGLAPKILPYYMNGYYERKAEKKMKLKLIFRDTKTARERAQWLRRFGYIDIRFIPEKYATPISVYVYGDKTAMILWSLIEPFAFRMDSSSITEGFRSYLSALWATAKKK
jgi:HTH-type transcriptional regulator, sugar sensing transcriptional regulator